MLRIFALGSAFVLAASTAFAADIVDGPRLHWNYSGWGKPRASSVAYQELAKFVEERTGGQWTIQVHWGTLSQPRAVLDGLQLGAFEAGSYCASYYPGKVPTALALELPFLPISSPDQQAKVADAYGELPAVIADFDRWDTINYHNSILPPYEVIGRGEPPKSLESWEGMRIRAPGPSGQSMAKIGAVPTSVPAPEVYTSLDRGLIDAAGFAYYSHMSYRTYELGDWYTSGLKYTTLNCGLALSKSAYNALPDEYKQLLVDYKPIGYKKQIEAFDISEKIEGPKTFEEAGLTKVTFTEEEHAKFVDIGGKPVWKEWIAKITADGYDGQMLVDSILGFAKEYKDYQY
jgi:TRAP-type C4-dicarboxylate transport system substrate-binding protein